MKTMQRGLTLIEMLGVLAVGAIMMVGLTALIDTSLEDTKSQQTAIYQSQVVNAAGKYLADNYLTLTGTASATAPTAVTVAMLKTGKYLSQNFSDTNAYGQTPCLLVLQPDPNKLDALLVTEGGVAIPAKTLPYVAANAGQGGGYIPEEGALYAQGAFGSSTIANATLTRFLSASCTGTAAGAGHLASSLFYDGPGSLTTDFLYRDAIPGRPELNRMTTPLHITLATGAVENTSDAACAVADTGTWGGVVVNTNGVILSCQSGVWRRQGSRYWRDPVLNHAELIALPTADNNKGDVRMVTDLSLAFTWDGSKWVALAVDQDGNLTMSGTLTAAAVNADTVTAGTVNLTQTETKDTACSPNGALSRAADGLVLSCKSGTWRSLLDTRITTRTQIVNTTFTGGTGTRDIRIPLPTPVNGPLYITGFTHCNSTGGARILVAVELFDAFDNRLGYSGGCGAQSEPGGKVLTKGFVGLQKIPQNAAVVRLYVEPGSLGGDYGLLDISLYDSE